MPLDLRKAIIAALFFIPVPTWANSVQRCTDESGNLTFTTLGCPPGHDMQLQQAYNAPTGTIAPGPAPPAPGAKTGSSHELVIVGQRDDGCGNVLSAEQRRKAIINYQTPAGMTKRDVESLLGRPDKVVSRNGEVKYVYEEKKGKSRQVSFDEHGCVKGRIQKQER